MGGRIHYHTKHYPTVDHYEWSSSSQTDRISQCRQYSPITKRSRTLLPKKVGQFKLSQDLLVLHV